MSKRILSKKITKDDIALAATQFEKINKKQIVSETIIKHGNGEEIRIYKTEDGVDHCENQKGKKIKKSDFNMIHKRKKPKVKINE